MKSSDVSKGILENVVWPKVLFENRVPACRFLIKQQYALCFSSNQTRVLAKVHKWECRIMAITSAFQADDAGSIPVIPQNNNTLSVAFKAVERVFFVFPQDIYMCKFVM